MPCLPVCLITLILPDAPDALSAAPLHSITPNQLQIILTIIASKEECAFVCTHLSIDSHSPPLSWDCY